MGERVYRSQPYICFEGSETNTNEFDDSFVKYSLLRLTPSHRDPKHPKKAGFSLITRGNCSRL